MTTTTKTAKRWNRVLTYGERYAMRAGISRDDATDIAQDAVCVLLQRKHKPTIDNMRLACRAILRHKRRSEYRQSLAYRPGMRFLIECPAKPERKGTPEYVTFVHGERPKGNNVTLERIDVFPKENKSIHVWKVVHAAKPHIPARLAYCVLRDMPLTTEQMERGYKLIRKVWRGYVRPEKRSGNSSVNEFIEYLETTGNSVDPRTKQIITMLANGYTRTEVALKIGVHVRMLRYILASLEKAYNERVTTTETVPVPAVRVECGPLPLVGRTHEASADQQFPEYTPDRAAYRVLWRAARHEARRRMRAERITAIVAECYAGYQNNGSGI